MSNLEQMKQAKLKQKLCDYINLLLNNKLNDIPKIFEPLQVQVVGLSQIADFYHYFHVHFDQNVIDNAKESYPELTLSNLTGSLIQLADWHFEHGINREGKLDFNLIIKKIYVIGGAGTTPLKEASDIFKEAKIQQKLFELERFLKLEIWEKVYLPQSSFDTIEQERLKKCKEYHNVKKFMVPYDVSKISSIREIVNPGNNIKNTELLTPNSELFSIQHEKRTEIKSFLQSSLNEETKSKNILKDKMSIEETKIQNSKHEIPLKRNYSNFLENQKAMNLCSEQENIIKPNKKAKVTCTINNLNQQGASTTIKSGEGKKTLDQEKKKLDNVNFFVSNLDLEVDPKLRGKNPESQLSNNDKISQLPKNNIEKKLLLIHKKNVKSNDKPCVSDIKKTDKTMPIQTKSLDQNIRFIVNELPVTKHYRKKTQHMKFSKVKDDKKIPISKNGHDKTQSTEEERSFKNTTEENNFDFPSVSSLLLNKSKNENNEETLTIQNIGGTIPLNLLKGMFWSKTKRQKEQFKQ